MHILIIGSASDLDGRKMASTIDGGEYDIVARVNKPYGAVEDVGTRTDIVFWCKEGFLTYWSGFKKAYPEAWGNAKYVCAVAPQIQGILNIFRRNKDEHFSTGFAGIVYMLAAYPEATVDAIGFGVKDGKYNPNGKVYTSNKYVAAPEDAAVCPNMEYVNTATMKDSNPNYDFVREHLIASSFERLRFI